MPQYSVTLHFEGANINSVAKKAREFFGEDAETTVMKVLVPTSRSERFSAAVSQVEDAKSEIEALRDEIGEWKDNLPENLQSSNKASELEECYNALDSMVTDLETLSLDEPTFPSMMG